MVKTKPSREFPSIKAMQLYKLLSEETGFTERQCRDFMVGLRNVLAKLVANKIGVQLNNFIRVKVWVVKGSLFWNGLKQERSYRGDHIKTKIHLMGGFKNLVKEFQSPMDAVESEQRRLLLEKLELEDKL